MKPFLRALVGFFSAGLVVSAMMIPGMGPQSIPAENRFAVDVDPLPLKIVCPGALVEVAGESGVEVGKVERYGTARIWPQGDSDIEVEQRSAEAYPILVSGNNQSTQLLSAIQTQAVDRSRAAGLLAGYCEQPLSSGWFVSGDGGVGRESTLMVANPNPVDTQLLLEFHFGGKVITERLVLAAGAERLVSLATLVGAEPAYAIYFESSGSPLAIALQHRYSDGLTPLGVSLTTAVRSAETTQWIAPLEILAEGYEKPRLRFFAPQNLAQVRVFAIGVGASSEFELSVESGELAELSISLAEGAYALRIESSEPVVVQVLNPSLTPLDYSWLSPLVSFTSLKIPLSNFSTELAVLNPGEGTISVEVRVRNSGQVEQSVVSLRPSEILMLPVAGEVLELNSQSSFMAALRVLDSVGYAVINPSENANPGQSLKVLVR